MSIIKMVINNREFTGWNSFNITRSLDTMTGSFNISLIDGIDDDAKVFNEIGINSNCQIFVDDVQLLDGYIFGKKRSRNADDVSFTLSGRDITADLVDCSAVYKNSTWKNTTLTNIVADLLEPFGLREGLISETDESFDKFAIEQGESVFNAIDRACRQKGIIPITNQFGDLVLRNFSAGNELQTIDSLVDGINVSSVVEDEGSESRFSDYTVKGQNSSGGSAWDEKSVTVSASSKDENVPRYRPLVIMSEGKTNQSQAQTRANWEAQIRAGRAKSYTVETEGFIQKSTLDKSAFSFRDIWNIGYEVSFESEPFDVNETLLISDVSMTFDGSGEKVVLTLKDRDTYKADPTKVIQ